MWHETRTSATEVLAEERLLLRLHSLRRNLARAATTDSLKRERKPVEEACGATFLGEQWPEKPAAQPCQAGAVVSEASGGRCACLRRKLPGGDRQVKPPADASRGAARLALRAAPAARDVEGGGSVQLKRKRKLAKRGRGVRLWHVTNLTWGSSRSPQTWPRLPVKLII